MTEKMTYTVSVIGIQEAADNFPRQHGGTGTVWCHNLDLIVEATGEQLQCQVCTDNPKLTEFAANDRIKVQAGRHTKGRTSVKFIEKLPAFRPSKPVYEPSPEVVGRMNIRNPVVTGTAMDRALYNACHLHQMQGAVDDEKVMATAKKFYDLLVEHTPIN